MLFKKAHFYFWITAVLILITGFFIYDKELKTVINIKDTYYVFVNRDFTVYITAFYVFVGATYWLYEKLNYRLSTFLTFLHTLLMCGGFIAYNIILWYDNKPKGLPHFKNIPNFSDHQDMNSYFVVFFIIMFSIQPFFLLNLITGGFKKK